MGILFVMCLEKYYFFILLNLNLIINSSGENDAKYLGEGISKCYTLLALNDFNHFQKKNHSDC